MVTPAPGLPCPSPELQGQPGSPEETSLSQQLAAAWPSTQETIEPGLVCPMVRSAGCLFPPLDRLGAWLTWVPTRAWCHPLGLAQAA